MWSCDDHVKSFDDDHLNIIWWSFDYNLMIIQRTSRTGLIVSAVDYHVIIWWSCDTHSMIIITQVPICYWSTNKQTKKLKQKINKQTNKQTNLNMMIMWLSCDYHKMIIICSYNDHLMIFWISYDDHVMIKRLFVGVVYLIIKDRCVIIIIIIM